MKQYVYIVQFSDGFTEKVICNGKKEAKILAQAIRIKDGKTYEVIDITKV